MAREDLHSFLQVDGWKEFQNVWEPVKLGAPHIVTLASKTPMLVSCPKNHPLFRVQLNIDDLSHACLNSPGGMMPRFNVTYIDPDVQLSDGLPRELYEGRPDEIPWEERLSIQCPVCARKGRKTTSEMKSNKLLRLVFETAAKNLTGFKLP